MYINGDAFSYFMKTSKDIFKSLPVKGLLALLMISVISIFVLYKLNWSGFGEDSNKPGLTTTNLQSSV